MLSVFSSSGWSVAVAAPYRTRWIRGATTWASP